jgi:hypothetical protein
MKGGGFFSNIFPGRKSTSEELTPLNPTGATASTEPNNKPQEVAKPPVPSRGEKKEEALTQVELAKKIERGTIIASSLIGVSSAVKNLPFGGVISGVLLLVASAIKTDGNLKRVSATIQEIEHDLIYTYLLFEVIKDASKKLNIKLDTTIIEEDATALVDMIKTMFEQDTTMAVRLKAQFLRDIDLEIHKLEDRVRRLERSMTNLYSSFDILKGNVDVLANVDDQELVERFKKAAGNQRSGSEFQEINDFIKRKNTPADNEIQANILKSVTRPENTGESILEERKKRYPDSAGGRRKTRKSRRRRSRKGKTIRRKKQ